MEFPKGGLIGKAVALFRRIRDMGISGHAANAGYFIVLAVFPALVLVLSLLRYPQLDADDLLALLSRVLPEALLAPAERLIISTYAHTSRTVVSVSAVGALWSAGRGIYGLLRGLNAIYGVEENRGYFQTRLMCMVYTFVFFLVLLMTLILNVFGEAILANLPPAEGNLFEILSEVLDLRWLVSLAVQTALFALMYTVLPNRNNHFRDSLPGALLAALGWMLFTELFSFYVENFTGYTGIYGSVYAVALSMLWLYFCLSILFFGGALNKLLQERKEKFL